MTVPTSGADRRTQQLERALALLHDGRFIRARDIVDRILERDRSDVQALRLSGDIARASGNLEVALDRYIAAAREQPGDTATLDAIVSVGTALERLDRATQALELAVIADPSSAPRHLSLAKGYAAWGRYEQALGHLRLAANLDPHEPRAWSSMGVALLHLEEHAQALAACERAIALDPDDAVSRVNAALALDELGRPDDADRYRSEAMSIAPGDPTVAFQTKDLVVAAPGDPRFDALQACADDPERNLDERVRAELALTKLWDDVGMTDRAAVALRSANARFAARLQRRGQAYDPERQRGHLRFLQEHLTVERLQGRQTPTTGPVPVLLCGLPRAGKSLLEARLQLATDATAIGERSLGVAALAAIEEHAGAPFGDAISTLDAAALAEIREGLLPTVLAEAADDSVTASAVLSTNPGNHEGAGPVLLLDPRTVIVSCERDPRDLLLAVFQQYFPAGNAFGWTVEGLVEHLRTVLGFIDHWSQVHGERVVRVRYEELVTDPAGPVAEVLTTMGRPVPDDLATRFAVDDSTTVAMSPTAKPDPRAPVHRAHVGMWRRWEAHLPNLFDAIEAAGLLETWED